MLTRFHIKFCVSHKEETSPFAYFFGCSFYLCVRVRVSTVCGRTSLCLRSRVHSAHIPHRNLTSVSGCGAARRRCMWTASASALVSPSEKREFAILRKQIRSLSSPNRFCFHTFCFAPTAGPSSHTVFQIRLRQLSPPPWLS